MITLEDLKKQLAQSEADLEIAKSHVYRLDGITQVLKHLIANFDNPDEAPPEGVSG